MKTIIIISQDVVLTNLIDGALGGLKTNYKTLVFSSIEHALDIIYNSIPDLIIAAVRSGDDPMMHRLTYLKEEPIFSQLPVLVVVEQRPAFDWDRLPIDDYIKTDEID
jgi:DNA-binding NtrC family response regulator